MNTTDTSHIIFTAEADAELEFARVSILGDRTISVQLQRNSSVDLFCTGLDNGEPAGIEFVLNTADKGVIDEFFAAAHEIVDNVLDVLERITAEYEGGDKDAYANGFEDLPTVALMKIAKRFELEVITW